LKRRPSD